MGSIDAKGRVGLKLLEVANDEIHWCLSGKEPNLVPIGSKAKEENRNGLTHGPLHFKGRASISKGLLVLADLPLQSIPCPP
jgi:hypothetical protein